MNVVDGVACDSRSVNSERMLSAAERDDFARALGAVRRVYDPGEADAFFSECRAAATTLPARLRAELESRPVTFFHGAPLDTELPRTGEHDSRRTRIADRAIAAIASMVGTPYVLAGKSSSGHIDDLFARRGDEDRQLSSNQVVLDWHVEDGFHAWRPDHVVLTCLRGDPRAATRLARADDLELPPYAARVLAEPRFEVAQDETFVSRSSPVRVPVLGGDGVVFDPQFTTCLDDEARAAFAVLREELERVSFSVVMAPGDVLVFDNRRVVHARTAYAARFDGADRWLKRVCTLARWRVASRDRGGVAQ